MKLWKRFKKCYDQRALDGVAEIIVGRRQRIDFTVTLLPPKKGLLLDVGGADGLLLQTVGANAVVGIDISRRNCKKMKRNGIESVNCVGEHLPFHDSAFDTVTCTEVLEHVLYPEEVIHETHRVLKNGGCVLFTVPYREKLVSHSSGNYEFAHLRTYNEKFASALSSMFAVQSVKYYTFRIVARALRLYNVVINRVLNALWRIRVVRAFFVSYHKHMKFLNIVTYIKPIYMITLAFKKL